MSEAARARLAALNSGINSSSNPGGLNGAGTARVFVRALNDVAAVGNDVAAAAAALQSNMTAIAGSMTAITASEASANQASASAVTARNEAVAAAAVVRSLPILLRDGSTAHVLTVSGSSIPLILRDGSTVFIPLT